MSRGKICATDLDNDRTDGNFDVDWELVIVPKDRVASNDEDVVFVVSSSLGGRDERRLVLEEQRVGLDSD